MTKQPKPASNWKNLRLYPEQRLCPKFDACSIAKFPVARRDEIALRVLDNCVEEHLQ